MIDMACKEVANGPLDLYTITVILWEIYEDGARSLMPRMYVQLYHLVSFMVQRAHRIADTTWRHGLRRSSIFFKNLHSQIRELHFPTLVRVCPFENDDLCHEMETARGIRNCTCKGTSKALLGNIIVNTHTLKHISRSVVDSE